MRVISNTPPYMCNVVGHDHELIHLWDIHQVGTGDVLRILECPTGRYRWHVLPYGGPSIRFTRPRFGWGKNWEPFQKEGRRS